MLDTNKTIFATTYILDDEALSRAHSVSERGRENGALITRACAIIANLYLAETDALLSGVATIQTSAHLATFTIFSTSRELLESLPGSSEQFNRDEVSVWREAKVDAGATHD